MRDVLLILPMLCSANATEDGWARRIDQLLFAPLVSAEILLEWTSLLLATVLSLLVQVDLIDVGKPFRLKLQV